MGFPVNVYKPVLCKAKRKHKHTQPWLISVNFKNSNICIHITHIFLCRISLFFSSSTFHGTSRSYGCVYPFSVIWPFDPCTRSSCTNACLGTVTASVFEGSPMNTASPGPKEDLHSGFASHHVKNTFGGLKQTRLISLATK